MAGEKRRQVNLRIPRSRSLAFAAAGAAVGLPLFLVALALALPFSAPQPGAPGQPAAPPPLAAPPAAVAALARRDCSSALNAIATAEPPLHRHLLSGLYAHACERPDLARTHLMAGGLGAAGAAGPLEDWRLFVLADSAAASGDLEGAAATAHQLLDRHPGSPLRHRALLRAVEIAGRRQDGETVRRLVARGREGELPADLAVRLEVLAWGLGQSLAQPALAHEAGRRLAAAAPAEAEALGVIPALAGTASPPDWWGFLGSAGCRRRAAALLALDRPGDAAAALDAVPEASRDHAWTFLAARALTDSRRGREVLPLLAALVPRDAAEAAKRELALATAKLEAAAVRQGRVNPPSGERSLLAAEAREHLVRAASQSADREVAIQALRRLFVELAGADRFDEALKVLTHLRRLDPRDRTGSRHLFAHGFKEYRQGNHSGAVGYWAELKSLYPESFDARRGRYWTARAYAARGQRERAREIFLEVTAADTNDFYRRHALERLGGAAAAPPQEAPAETWPQDPRLARAELLAGLGLGSLAEAELDALTPAVEARAAAALRARLLAARGEHRSSIQALVGAFEGLGSARQGGLPEQALLLYYPLGFQREIRAAAAAEGLSPLLVAGMVRQESAFDLTATSRAGARGLMQLMPATGREVARRLGLPYSSTLLLEPATNVRLGCAYFRQVLDLFDRQLELALAGYNGGPYRIRRLWQASRHREIDLFIEDLPVEESRSYVRRVLLLMDSYRQLYPELADGAGQAGRDAG